MLFNSLDFAIFLPIVFVLYWFVTNKNLKIQNLLIVISSYVFYGWWDWRFLVLILFSTIVDFTIGNLLNKETKIPNRKALLWMSIVFNLGLLGFFKYYNFFVESFSNAFTFFGTELKAHTLYIILPVGISFYTFQTLSYTIDVYRKKLEPTNDFISFAAFVSFFPQLVAGPIERATNLLPQFYKIKKFDYNFAVSGVKLIIWGLFKKVVIADNCAFFVNQIFDNPVAFSSSDLFLGAVFFAFQIYGDFSGYSDIAIGTARFFGFKLMTNFSFPYFSKDIADFWRRWHISLSSWFRDYLYIPLGGSKGSKIKQIRNIFIIFLVSGFWHGANWTFIVWGGIHSLLFLPLLLYKRNRKHVQITSLKINDSINVISTFLLVTIAWVFFRADSFAIALDYLYTMFTNFEGELSSIFVKTSKNILFSFICILSIIIMLLYEYNAIQKKEKEVVLSRISVVIISLLILFLGVFKNPSEFIYFQF